MSHKPNVISPESTRLIDRTVGELVAERPGRSRIFQSLSIDFCCQGRRTLREACRTSGVPLDSVVGQLEAEWTDKHAPLANPAELSPHELATYIVETHHGFLKRELPRLHAMAQRVAQVHGGHTPSLVKVFDVFCGLSQELDSHMMKEEQILFPAVAAMSRGESVSMPL
ncbi:MAG: DUF542 domain-containing protein, partial [Terrimicrobiaceae bacterium]|nr:DUF542 domain-containing protein [Terrimicrobiaceae bacterium]